MAGEQIDPADFGDFSGMDPECPMCLTVGAGAYWVPTGVIVCTNGQLDWNGQTWNVPDLPGFLVRFCRTCNYQWPENSAQGSAQQPLMASLREESLAASDKAQAKDPKKPGASTKSFAINQPVPVVLEVQK